MLGNTKNNPGICDVCGQKFMRRDLRYQVIAGKSTKVLTCMECWDQDNPQLLIGRVKAVDPNPIPEPRPDDQNFLVSRGAWAWNPVGGSGLAIQMWPQRLITPTTNTNSTIYRIPE